MSAKFVWFDRAYLDSIFAQDALYRKPKQPKSPPLRDWVMFGYDAIVSANTKSEARALLKKVYGVIRKREIIMRVE